MRLTFAILAGCVLLSACATDTPAQSEHERTCAVLAATPRPTQDPSLSEAERATLHAMTPQPLAPPTYQCGEIAYQTDPNRLGLTYTAVGFSADGEHAAVSLQTVAGPLAGGGFNCLLNRQSAGWQLRGCEMTWIS